MLRRWEVKGIGCFSCMPGDEEVDLTLARNGEFVFASEANRVINGLLDLIGEPVNMCKDCGFCTTDILRYMHPPDGVSVCPECGGCESFQQMEAGE